jgi:hypothetical protein
MDKWDYMKLNSFCSFCATKEMVCKLKWPPTEWEKIFPSYISDKGLITRIYRELNKEMGNSTEQNFFKDRNPNDQKTHEKMLTNKCW